MQRDGAVRQAVESYRVRDLQSVLHPYTDLAAHETRGPLVIERGHGIFVVDEDGREYIEGIAGLWCTAFGFDEAELIEAAIEQMRTLPFYHTAMHRSTKPVIELSEALKAMAPGRMARVFLTNSGSEANDTQIKLLWYYNNACGRPAKKKIVSRLGAYHGATLASGSLTGLPMAHRDFDLPLPQVRHVGRAHYYRDAKPGESEEEFATRLAAELETLIVGEGPETVAAFIAEPVMGAGGVIVPPSGYFAKIQAVLRRYDVRLIVDEVICGFGRTGEMWGCDTYGIEPHSISCAKSLAGAYMPIGAVLVDDEMYRAFVDESRKIGTFGHGFTFGGHPTPAAVALRTLELMRERDVLGHVRRVSQRFLGRLRALGEHPLVGEARGVGLLGALEFVADKRTRRPFDQAGAVGSHVAARCEHHGLIVRPLGDSVALCPPLVITEAEVDELFTRLERALDDTERWRQRA